MGLRSKRIVLLSFALAFGAIIASCDGQPGSATRAKPTAKRILPSCGDGTTLMVNGQILPCLPQDRGKPCVAEVDIAKGMVREILVQAHAADGSECRTTPVTQLQMRGLSRWDVDTAQGNFEVKLHAAQDIFDSDASEEPQTIFEIHPGDISAFLRVSVAVNLTGRWQLNLPDIPSIDMPLQQGGRLLGQGCKANGSGQLCKTSAGEVHGKNVTLRIGQGDKLSELHGTLLSRNAMGGEWEGHGIWSAMRLNQ